jgi:hypothetical protein
MQRRMGKRLLIIWKKNERALKLHLVDVLQNLSGVNENHVRVAAVSKAILGL